MTLTVKANFLKKYMTPNEWCLFCLKKNKESLKAFAKCIKDNLLRENELIPPHYTAKVFCKSCDKEVPIWETDVKEIAGCPWCFTRTFKKHYELKGEYYEN